MEVWPPSLPDPPHPEERTGAHGTHRLVPMALASLAGVMGHMTDSGKWIFEPQGWVTSALRHLAVKEPPPALSSP